MGEPIYMDPEFWVAVAFVLLVVIGFRPLKRVMFKGLDAHSAQVADELAQARRLREEAQTLLVAYQKKQRDSLREAEAILNGAKKEAAAMYAQAEAQLQAAVEKRKKLAMEKIAQAESKALQDVQSHVADIAVSVARTVIASRVARSGNDDALKQVAAELEHKLH